MVIENTDVFDGVFRVKLRLYDLKGLYGAENLTADIPAGANATLRAEFDTHYGQEVRGEVSVMPPTAPDQRQVTRRRRVLKSIVDVIVSG